MSSRGLNRRQLFQRLGVGAATGAWVASSVRETAGAPSSDKLSIKIAGYKLDRVQALIDEINRMSESQQQEAGVGSERRESTYPRRY